MYEDWGKTIRWNIDFILYHLISEFLPFKVEIFSRLELILLILKESIEIQRKRYEYCNNGRSNVKRKKDAVWWFNDNFLFWFFFAHIFSRPLFYF